MLAKVVPGVNPPILGFSDSKLGIFTQMPMKMIEFDFKEGCIKLSNFQTDGNAYDIISMQPITINYYGTPKRLSSTHVSSSQNILGVDFLIGKSVILDLKNRKVIIKGE
jgi:hypothetical protein